MVTVITKPELARQGQAQGERLSDADPASDPRKLLTYNTKHL